MVSVAQIIEYEGMTHIYLPSSIAPKIEYNTYLYVSMIMTMLESERVNIKGDTLQQYHHHDLQDYQVEVW